MRRTRVRSTDAAQPARWRRFGVLVSVLFAGTFLGAGDAAAQNLEEYDYERAGEQYAAVATRWAPAQALGYVN